MRSLACVMLVLTLVTAGGCTKASESSDAKRMPKPPPGPIADGAQEVRVAVDVDGVAQPKAIVEAIDFNGDGTLISPFATVSLNGVIIRSTNSVGTYTVAENCSGTLTFTAGPSFDIFVGRHAREISMIQTGGPVPAVFEGLAKKVSR